MRIIKEIGDVVKVIHGEGNELPDMTEKDRAVLGRVLSEEATKVKTGEIFFLGTFIDPEQTCEYCLWGVFELEKEQAIEAVRNIIEQATGKKPGIAYVSVLERII